MQVPWGVRGGKLVDKVTGESKKTLETSPKKLENTHGATKRELSTGKLETNAELAIRKA